MCNSGVSGAAIVLVLFILFNNYTRGLYLSLKEVN